jgi:hypothetical protein
VMKTPESIPAFVENAGRISADSPEQIKAL